MSKFDPMDFPPVGCPFCGKTDCDGYSCYKKPKSEHPQGEAMSKAENKEELPGMLELAKAISEQRWPQSIDAQVWADEWLKTIADHPDIATDKGSMIGWFANAIMAGYDTANFRAIAAKGEAMSEKRSVEQILAAHVAQGGLPITLAESLFLNHVREAAMQGVGYGWMQQVIEWEWRYKSEFGHAWGPEYFEKRDAANQAKLAAFEQLETALRDLLYVITSDDLLPESLSYMKQARLALSAARKARGE